MIRTVLEMRVREGRTAEFEQVWRTAAAVAARYRGAGRQTMLRDPVDPLAYTITADWATREDLGRYQSSRDRQELSEVLERLREAASKTLLEVVAQVAPAPAPVGEDVSTTAGAPAREPVTVDAQEGSVHA
ncbi:antibiotic biosynthesis monooxygenase [Streptomyces sp. HPF1205]|uniref:antibiotic biosynthesis monooxygenase family protein n=1 Tax=Streptomyces sp. HPF1205 TaxID=2873262 RepID=UPI001CED9F18|nr:antibiotic biosynthesis monooxygenase [Streptomyces sp. HPF1205]